MAINVTYQVPASLLQQQRQAENRAYKRQVNLMTMQQNFQREQTEANRQFQRETMQTAYDRQREKTADERAYQQDLLAHKEGREDAIRKQAMDLAQKQQQEAQIQQAETAAWQDSERQRQALEKQFNYTDTQIAEMKQLAADERDAYQQYSQGLISPEQYRSALGQLRARRMGIMPETPKSPEETMSLEDRIKSSTMWHPELKCLVGMNSKGEVYTINPPQDSVSAKLKRDKVEALNNARKSCMVDGVLNQKEFDKAKKEIEEIYGVDNGDSAQQKPQVPQTAGGYVNTYRGGGNPLQQMRGGQQPQEPVPMEQQEQVAAQVEEEAQANKLDELKSEYESLEKKANLNPWHASTSYYRRRQEQVKKQIEEEEAKQAKQAKPVEHSKPKEEPKHEEPKRQRVNVMFRGLSKVEDGEWKAWIDGKRLGVGDKLPNGGVITSMDYDSGTLTYKIDGEEHTIRKNGKQMQSI